MTEEQLREARLTWMEGMRQRALAAVKDHTGAVNAGIQSPAEKAWSVGFIEGHMVAQEEMVWPLRALATELAEAMDRVVCCSTDWPQSAAALAKAREHGLVEAQG